MTRVVERVRSHAVVDELVVATDSPMVAQVVKQAGVEAVMTRSDHPSGTDRVAEVAALPDYSDYQVILNVQGDEPFISLEAMSGALQQVADGADVGTAATVLEPGQQDDPHVAKVVLDSQGRALWFSRAPIPAIRDENFPIEGLYLGHVGIYAYRRDALERWVSLTPTRAELAEKLEQLRPLHYGLTVGVALLHEAPQPGVDTPEDLKRAEEQWLTTAKETG